MICCVTGHRPSGFPFPRNMENISYVLYIDELYTEIQSLIGEGYRDFITGMAEGADIDFAKAILYYRDVEMNITLEAAMPYPITYPKIPSEYIDERNDIFSVCDTKTVVSEHYFRGCMQKRNCYMVDKADIVLAIWNGKCEGGTWNTIKYARSKGKKIRYIMLNDFLNNPKELV